MDLYEAIQQEAMAAVVDPDDAAWLRRVSRYYSKTFATPLHLVKQLPLEDVLQAVFEDMFENMDEEDREERIEWLLMSDSERAEHHDAEKVLGDRDDAFFDNLNKSVASGEMIQRPKEQKRELAATDAAPLPAGMEKLARMVARTKARAAKLAGVSLPASKPSAPAAAPEKESKQPAMLGDLPEINLSFDSKTSNLGGKDWSDLDPLGPPRKTKKA